MPFSKSSVEYEILRNRVFLLSVSSHPSGESQSGRASLWEISECTPALLGWRPSSTTAAHRRVQFVRANRSSSPGPRRDESERRSRPYDHTFVRVTLWAG